MHELLTRHPLGVTQTIKTKWRSSLSIIQQSKSSGFLVSSPIGSPKSKVPIRGETEVHHSSFIQLNCVGPIFLTFKL